MSAVVHRRGRYKKQARFNCMEHLLNQILEITLPLRVFNPDYERNVLPPKLCADKY
jgi:hypothetical protein